MALKSMREREGKHLAKDLVKRLKVVRDCVRKIRQLQPGVLKRYRQSLHERIQRAGIDLPFLRGAVVGRDRQMVEGHAIGLRQRGEVRTTGGAHFLAWASCPALISSSICFS